METEMEHEGTTALSETGCSGFGMSQPENQPAIRVFARNIGGIEGATVNLAHGVNVLVGRNATNRTSFLQAVMAALGSNKVSLKRDAEEGYAELQLEEQTYSRDLRRQNSDVVRDGTPYLDNPEVADLFAFLLEKNEARRAVELDEDLRDIIMRPVDVEAIQSEISTLVEERREIDQQLDELQELESRIRTLQARESALTDEIEDKQQEFSTRQTEIENLDSSIQEAKQENQQMEQLREKQSELEDVRFRLSSERESLEALEDELAELQEMQEELPDSPETAVGEIDAEIERARKEKEELDATINEIQSIIQFNESMLDEKTDIISFSTDYGEPDGSVTDRLVQESEETVCWTCGSTVEEQAIESTIDHLRDLRERHLGTRNELSGEISDMESERNRIQELSDRHQQIRSRIDSTEAEIGDRRENIESLERERDELTEQIEALETAVDESSEYGQLIELHKEANRLEVELENLESDRDDIRTEISNIRSKIDERDQLQERRTTLSNDISELRNRVERMEESAVSNFNDHMEDLLAELEYENLERIWIERVQREVKEGRRKRIKSMFDLHIVRTTSDGTTYEDTVDHLSESEREIVGLVFALAGYLTHDVTEVLPFMILDSLEAIDSDRIADLIDYLENIVPNVVVALLPEDASALSSEYHYVTEI
jgi:DNA repair exonuclease SbcCD ATPase subunit